jgi:predicted Rossmann fold flavoprotein
MKYDVVVLGAGAAGLMAAITAALRNRTVLIIERSNKVGKKILMSGGGRCNFTNKDLEFDNFLSKNKHFCKSALSRYTAWDFIDLVKSHDIDFEERKHSQLFCVHSAKDIVKMLLDECEEKNVKIIKNSEVKTVKDLEIKNPNKDRYRVCGHEIDNKTENKFQIDCESLIIATGALSIPTLGGSDFGYRLAEQYNLPLVNLSASLVPFMFSDYLKPFCESLSGVSLDAEVFCNNKSFRENILFTHRGLSGPAILQISNYWIPGQEISIDLLPDRNITDELLEEKKLLNTSLLRNYLAPYLSKSLASKLQDLLWEDIAEIPLSNISKKKLVHIGSILNRWVIKPSSTEGYRTAEVTKGGIDTDFINSQTMEVKDQRGLYFVGEVLDVTGHLGGFNFQWAWSSGFCAGLDA